MSWAADTYVTGANPPPGRVLPLEGPRLTGTRSDGGIGINTYIAGGAGPGGSVPVDVVSGSFSGTVAVVQPVSSSHFALSPPTASQTLLAPNASRVSFILYNGSERELYVHLGPSASLEVFSFVLAPLMLYEVPYPGWRGEVSVIAGATGSGSVHAVELVP